MRYMTLRLRPENPIPVGPGPLTPPSANKVLYRVDYVK